MLDVDLLVGVSRESESGVCEDLASEVGLDFFSVEGKGTETRGQERLGVSFEGFEDATSGKE